MSTETIKALTYDQALKQAQDLIQELEQYSGQYSVQELLDKSKLAAALITHCRSKITGIEQEVKKIIDSLPSETNDTPASNEEEDYPF